MTDGARIRLQPMLIAEIHGKRFPEAEGQEDLLTSAVFGHLRHIAPGLFWPDLLDRAHMASERISLGSRIRAAGVQLWHYPKLEIRFWEQCGRYGEPDLILHFSGGAQPSLIVVIEVKLDSGKSGSGGDDQLKRYLQFLNDSSALRDFPAPPSLRFLVYLTRAFSKLEIEESVRISVQAGIKDAGARIFGLQWQDVLESAEANADSHELLDEVARFLKIREFEAFRGFRSPPAGLNLPSGAFYGRTYFARENPAFQLDPSQGGKFYGV